MDEQQHDLIIPIVSEEAHADAVPVVTGGVRITKQVKSQDEVLEQELRRTHVEVKRVKTNQVVAGPQPQRRVGKTLIIPVVSEVLKIEKQFVVTEEIHITELEETETVRETVAVNHETAKIERLNAQGDVVENVPETGPKTRLVVPSIVEQAGNRTKRNLFDKTESLLKRNPEKP